MATGSESEERGARVGDERSSIDILDDNPAFAANPHYLRLHSVDRHAAVVNEGFRGMGVRAGERYLFSVHARSNGDAAARLRVALVSPDGDELASARIADIGSEWSKHTAVLEPRETEAKAQLVIALEDSGSVDLDMVSRRRQMGGAQGHRDTG